MTVANYREIYDKYVPISVYTVALSGATALLTVVIGFVYALTAAYEPPLGE